MRWKWPSRIVIGLFVVVFLIPLLDQLVGFRYLVVIENDPLLDPVRVESLVGQTIVLADGRAFELGWITSDWEEVFAKQMMRGDLQVDLDPKGGNSPTVHAKHPQFICGMPWCRLINIPLFADKIPGNRRQYVGEGKRVKVPKGLQETAPNP